MSVASAYCFLAQIVINCQENLYICIFVYLYLVGYVLKYKTPDILEKTFEMCTSEVKYIYHKGLD